MTTYYLEMTSPATLKPKANPVGIDIVEAEIKEFRFNCYLYHLIGKNWSWTDRQSLPDADWEAYAESDNLRTWVAYCRGSIAGYYELQRQEGDNVEIAHLGLAPRFLGRHLGGYLLTHALKSAWLWGNTKRIWLHTCTLDHKFALPNYQARGMTIYKTEESE